MAEQSRWISVKEFASIKSVDTAEVVQAIRDGHLEGSETGGRWFVLRSELGKEFPLPVPEQPLEPKAETPSEVDRKPQTETAAATCSSPQAKREALRVKVVDVDISFAQMVWLLIKLVIAAIPAGIIVAVLGLLAAMLFVWVVG